MELLKEIGVEAVGKNKARPNSGRNLRAFRT